MNRKFIYLAGPITGCSYGEAVEWRSWVKARLPKGLIGISPMRMKEFLTQEKSIGHSYEGTIMSGAVAICTRDFYDCTHADMVIAYLPKWANERRPSVGTIMEIGWASAKGIPVVVVSDDPTIIDHPLIKGKAGWIVPTLEDAVDAVYATFGAYIEE